MLYIGIDLGGTNIAAGIVNEEGKILFKGERKTLVGRPYQQIIQDMGELAVELLKNASISVEEIAAIGVGIPGIGDNRTGNIIFCTNLFWNNIPLREELQKYINLPVYIENDATVAGFAESVAGISKNSRSSVFLTLGTGVGAGIIIDGKPWVGAHGVASEIGHITLEIDGIPCTCGKDGCLERYCSATALIRMGKEACYMHPNCAIARACEGDLEKMSAKIIVDAAKEGDDIAVRLFHRYCRYLALAVNTVTSFLDPEIVVLGGGVSKAGSFLLDTVRAKLPHYLMYKELPYPELALAELGNDAGIIGSALITKSFMEETQC